MLLYPAETPEISPWHDALVRPPLNLAHLYHDILRAYVQFVVTAAIRPVFRSN